MARLAAVDHSNWANDLVVILSLSAETGEQATIRMTTHESLSTRVLVRVNRVESTTSATCPLIGQVRTS
jgi:hypothetical protein